MNLSFQFDVQANNCNDCMASVPHQADPWQIFTQVSVSNINSPKA